MERTECNCYCSKISGILASPLSPGTVYTTATLFIRCFFFARQLITKISLLNVYYIFSESVLFLQDYFLKDVFVAFKVPLQTYRNANIWKHSLRSVCSIIRNLGLYTQGFTESHWYLACSYFRFWNKVRWSVVAEKYHTSFTVLSCRQMKLNDFDRFSFYIFYFCLNQKLKVTLEEIMGQEVPTDMDQTWKNIHTNIVKVKKTVKFHIQQSAEHILSEHWSNKKNFFCGPHLPSLYHLCTFPVICCRKLDRLRGSHMFFWEHSFMKNRKITSDQVHSTSFNENLAKT